MTAGEIRTIHIARKQGGTMETIEQAELIAGGGIRGEAHFGSKWAPGQLTFIAEEQIAYFNANGLPIRSIDTRRNIATAGVDLNALVRQRFCIGDAVIEGLELCEPCATIGNRLADDNHTPRDIVAKLLHRAGLRARILQGGTVAVGDSINVQES